MVMCHQLDQPGVIVTFAEFSIPYPKPDVVGSSDRQLKLHATFKSHFLGLEIKMQAGYLLQG